jgi:hypothetical protein
MNVIVQKKERKATILVDLNDDDDRQLFIQWLKQIQCRNVADQFLVDDCIKAAGGEPEHGFPGYDLMQQ